jgi:hypothetical protein
MQSRLVVFTLCLLMAAALAFGQVGNGTITGTVTDQAGAVLAGAAVQAKNAATGVVYNGVSTGGGNYTITDLPVGGYVVTVTAKGFKTYTHTNLTVEAAGTLREDVALQVGANTESVTVTAEASLLKTETGELADNVTIDQMDALPMLGVGTINSGTSGFRNPYNTLLTLPGVSGYSSSGTFEINGLGAAFVTTETMRTEGQDATSRLFGVYDYTQMAQPSVDAVQEIAYQTSNYAPEFGQAGSVVINMTMKSGTNQYHGTGYDYFVNEDLNAGDPFTQSGGCIVGPTGQETCSKTGGDDGKYRPRSRRNDFGGTLGGPIYIPKIYNGHNKSFFFFNYEEFLETDQYGFTPTVPTAAYLAGNFSAISPNGNCSSCTQLGIQQTALGTPVQIDPNGNQVFANEIFNPLSRAQATSGSLLGQGYATPFPNNSIPATMFNPISEKILSFVPAANLGTYTANYNVNQAGQRYSAIPGFKIDHNIDAKDKLSFYYSENTTANQYNPTLGEQDGFPLPITAARGSFITNYQERLNYDRTLSSTLLLHIGAGLYHQSFVDNSPELTFNDQSELGLAGALVNRNFPIVNVSAGPQGTGGLQELGPYAGQGPSYEMRPTGTSSVTWVKGKHTFKFGAEWIYEQAYSKPHPLVTLSASNAATTDPFTNVSSYGAYTPGFAFASFLLGDLSSTNQSLASDTRFATMDWAVYIQDSWKVTRKLTLDYGLRWDYDTPDKEQYGRAANLDATGINTNAGDHLGNYQYAQTCGCQFYKSAYPLALGPRLGVAYQIDPKTVFRGGWGVNYQFVSNAAGATVGTAGAPNITIQNPTYVPTGAQFINVSAPGAVVAPNWPIVNQPSIYPLLGSVGNAPTVPDGQENRPPRINQWSAGFQREITRSFIMEASYVANHAAWLEPFGTNLGFLSELSPTYLATWGLYPVPGTGPAGYNNENDRALLADPLSSSAVQQKLASIGRAGYLPYAGFPTSQTLQAALYPYPQYGGVEPAAAPTGDSKYNSLQMKATKRLSHSLQAGGSFTWGQGFTRIQGRQDYWNPASSTWALQQIPPLTLNFNAVYTVPRASFFPKFVNQITKDWQLGFFANYQSGAFLAPPTSVVNSNYLGSADIRVAGQPLYMPGVNPNNQSTYNPWTTQLLNPAAWTACPLNATCTSNVGGYPTYYKDFRAPRTPTENANIARNFRIKERMNFQIRGEFVNIFNRTIMPAPSTANPQAAVTKNTLGYLTGGYGVISAFYAPSSAPAPPTASTEPYLESRQGTLIGRFSF